MTFGENILAGDILKTIEHFGAIFALYGFRLDKGHSIASYALRGSTEQPGAFLGEYIGQGGSVDGLLMAVIFPSFVQRHYPAAVLASLQTTAPLAAGFRW